MKNQYLLYENMDFENPSSIIFWIKEAPSNFYYVIKCAQNHQSYTPTNATPLNEMQVYTFLGKSRFIIDKEEIKRLDKKRLLMGIY